MKILEALKRIKHLDRKVEKNIQRIKEWCSFIQDKDSTEPPLYSGEDIRRMMQQNHDWKLEVARLRHLLHKTNLLIKVDFLGRTYNIDELLLLQNVVFPADKFQLECLKRASKSRFGRDEKDVIVITQYDPREKDVALDGLEHQLMELNDLLDQLSITTDLVE